MRQPRILTLYLLEEAHRFFVMPRCAQKRESVVQLFAGGIRRQLERLLKLPDSFLLSGRILVERLAEIAVLRQLLVLILPGAGRLHQQRK